MRISRDQLLKLQKRHHTDAAIARLFGLSRQAVHQTRDKFGIDPVPNRHARRNAELARAYRAGASGARLARSHRMSVSQVYRVLAAEGVALRKPRSSSEAG
jgi:hypothetical protein